MEVKICPYYMKYCECDDEEYATCDLSSVYPRQTEELFDTPFGSMKAKDGLTESLFDSRAIKPEKYAELREQDFDTWLDTILHEIIEQVNFDAQEVDWLGDAVWNGECPDGTPYPKVCAKEDAYIQCIRLSNQLDSITKRLAELERKVGDINSTYKGDLDALLSQHDGDIDTLTEDVATIKAWINHYELSNHTGCNYCGNCVHYVCPKSSLDLPTCDLSGEIVDTDSASCTMFEPPF